MCAVPDGRFPLEKIESKVFGTRKNGHLLCITASVRFKIRAHQSVSTSINNDRFLLIPWGDPVRVLGSRLTTLPQRKKSANGDVRDGIDDG